jgi:hypothetical protein
MLMPLLHRKLVKNYHNNGARKRIFRPYDAFLFMIFGVIECFVLSVTASGIIKATFIANSTLER